MKKLSVEFKLCNSEYMTALRLVAGAVCSSADVDVDVLEDFKVCITESALILKECGFESVRAQFDSEGGVSASLCGVGGTAREGECELSLALIGALVRDCDIHKEGGIIDRVTLKL